MWVLTFAVGLHGPEGRAQCMRQVADFAAAIRAEYGNQPYWYSPELHPDGHGWHVNFFVARRLKHDQMTTLWGHGHVWAKDWAQDHRLRGLPLVARIRFGALYGCKYASKDWSAAVLVGGAHRYEIAQGFQPRMTSLPVPSMAAGLRAAALQFGRPPDTTWASYTAEGWEGPPVVVMSWTTFAAKEDRDDG